VSSTVAIAGYSSFLVGAVLMGVLANYFGLRTALESVAVIGVADSLLAGLLMAARKPRTAPFPRTPTSGQVKGAER
jgi:hypothetical protein